jgi:hypothetical protein
MMMVRCALYCIVRPAEQGDKKDGRRKMKGLDLDGKKEKQTLTESETH